ncbi:MAG: efflux RND transporter permease subunit, partial [Roseimicrobium sp.]
TEDKGYLMAVFNLPPAASLNRTSEAATKAEAVIRSDPAVASVLAVLGLDFLGGGAAPNTGVIFIRLKDYAERVGAAQHSTAVAQRISRLLATQTV